MTFTFEGRDYRIAFKHDRPRDWASHVGHKLSLMHHGALYCVSCELQLSHLSKAERARRSHCTIYQVVDVSAEINDTEASIVIASASSRPHAKTAKCPGDCFSREGGRRAALANALECLPTIASLFNEDNSLADADTVRAKRKAFRAAAWAAYNARGRNYKADADIFEPKREAAT
jgi:hypothetical protein